MLLLQFPTPNHIACRNTRWGWKCTVTAYFQIDATTSIKSVINGNVAISELRQIIHAMSTAPAFTQTWSFKSMPVAFQNQSVSGSSAISNNIDACATAYSKIFPVLWSTSSEYKELISDIEMSMASPTAAAVPMDSVESESFSESKGDSLISPRLGQASTSYVDVEFSQLSPSPVSYTHLTLPTKA